MTHPQMVKIIDALIIFHLANNHPAGIKFEASINLPELKGLSKSELMHVNNYLMLSPYFEYMEKNSFGDYGTFKLKAEGYELVHTYDSYERYLSHKKSVIKNDTTLITNRRIIIAMTIISVVLTSAFSVTTILINRNNSKNNINIQKMIEIQNKNADALLKKVNMDSLLQEKLVRENDSLRIEIKFFSSAPNRKTVK